MAQAPISDEDSDSSNLPSSTQQHSDEDSEIFYQGTRRKRNRNYSENLWPKRVKKEICNILVAHEEGKYETLESVNVKEKKYAFFQHMNSKYEPVLAHNTFEIKTTTVTMQLPCKPSENDEMFNKAKFLYQQVMAFPQITDINDHKIYCRPYRDARPAEPDSDGEDIVDHAVFPEFDEVNMVLVTHYFRRFFGSYETALNIGLYNAIGKAFINYAWEYINLCLSSLDNCSKFKFLQNTSKGEAQPGATFVTWSLSQPRNMRSITESRIMQTRERYADHVVYDKVHVINVCVSKVKENIESSIEAQNNEQMLGLWNSSQQVMLGLELRGSSVRPKILALHGTEMHMYYLNELSIEKNNDLVELLKLMSSFLICVKYNIDLATETI